MKINFKKKAIEINEVQLNFNSKKKTNKLITIIK